MLFRKIESFIRGYLTLDSNKILVIDGARQIGKSYIIRKVGEDLFKENYIEINFVADKEGGSSMTLIEEGDASLVFSKLKVGGNNLFPYKLQYSLNTKSKDGENTVIKTIEFFFFDDLLTEFRASTTEYFPK